MATISPVIHSIRVQPPLALRLIHVLYRIASDPPNWRHPLIEVETNELLDALLRLQ